LASSRPDLIEVDLQRPGRVDLKIPLFPTTTPREGFDLLRMLCAKRGLAIAEDSFPSLESRIPSLLTPGPKPVPLSSSRKSFAANRPNNRVSRA
jgi:hypothetical protein